MNTILISILITISSLLIAGCENRLSYNPKEHLGFVNAGNASLHVSLSPESKLKIKSIGLYPNTSYLEGSLGLKKYDRYNSDNRYLSLVQEQSYIGDAILFKNLPAGNYYVIGWFVKEDKIPTLPGNMLFSNLLVQTIDQGGSATYNGRTYTRKDIIYKSLYHKYGLAVTCTIDPNKTNQITLCETSQSNTVYVPHTSFLGEKDVYAIMYTK